MEQWYRALLNYVRGHPPNCGDDDAESILEMVYSCYNQYNQMDTVAIKEGFEELYERMTGMPLRDMDDIIYTACSLCREHEKSGFVAGIKVGIRLAEEMRQ